MTDNPVFIRCCLGCVAAAHIVTDFLWFKEAYKILNELGRTVPTIAVASALPTLRIGYDRC